MNDAVAQVETRYGPVTLPRRRLTVAEFHRMGEAGVLGEHDRVELIEGALIEMAPIGSRHASVVDELNRRLTRACPDAYRVRVQNPLRLDERTEPQPDVAVVHDRADRYTAAHPGPADTVLVVEVADTTAVYDRQVKVPLYAQAGVAEVWLVDLEGGTVTVFREPRADGYAQVREARAKETLQPAACPEVAIPVARLLPPVAAPGQRSLGDAQRNPGGGA